MSGAFSEIYREIGYRFNDPELLQLALSHRSFSSKNNERLEFLGDSILGFVISEILYGKFTSATEGQLSRARSQIVKGDSLAVVGRAINLGKHLCLGEGELKSGGFDRPSILADGLEAIIGAIYLDGGESAAREFIERHFTTLLDAADPLNTRKDPKTRLQELLQKRGQRIPEYLVIDVSGASHEQQFSVQCILPDTGAQFSGLGSSKRRAEQAAASQALQTLGINLAGNA